MNYLVEKIKQIIGYRPRLSVIEQSFKRSENNHLTSPRCLDRGPTYASSKMQEAQLRLMEKGIDKRIKCEPSPTSGRPEIREHIERILFKY